MKARIASIVAVVGFASLLVTSFGSMLNSHEQSTYQLLGAITLIEVVVAMFGTLFCLKHTYGASKVKEQLVVGEYEVVARPASIANTDYVVEHQNGRRVWMHSYDELPDKFEIRRGKDTRLVPVTTSEALLSASA